MKYRTPWKKSFLFIVLSRMGTHFQVGQKSDAHCLISWWCRSNCTLFKSRILGGNVFQNSLAKKGVEGISIDLETETWEGFPRRPNLVLRRVQHILLVVVSQSKCPRLVDVLGEIQGSKRRIPSLTASVSSGSSPELAPMEIVVSLDTKDQQQSRPTRSIEIQMRLRI